MASGEAVAQSVLSESLENVLLLLDNGNYDKAIETVKLKDNLEVLKKEAWDFTPRISDYLILDNETDKPQLIDACDNILNYLAETGNPKELLLVLLEQADCFKDDVKYRILLLPVQKCLQRLTKKKGHSLAIALETFYGHLKAQDAPEEHDLEGEERKLLDLDENIIRINRNVMATLNFTEPFVEEVAWMKVSAETRKASQKQISELAKFLIQMLDYPLCYLDLTYNKGTDEKPCAKSTSRVIAEQISNQLGKLIPCVHKFMQNAIETNEKAREYKAVVDAKKANQEEHDALDDLDAPATLPPLGLAVYCYLVFGERLVVDCIPQVYTHKYWFMYVCPLITPLLKSGRNFINYKGAILFAQLVEHIPVGSISHELLEWDVLLECLNVFIRVIIKAQVKDLSQLAVITLKGFIQKFNVRGKYKLLTIMLRQHKHSGFAGFTIGILKDEIGKTLNSSTPNQYFIGTNLEKVLNVVFSLPTAETTDLLEYNEQIMGALNLLRFVILRDKPDTNTTGIWTLMPTIQKKYCETLRKGINISRAHYQLDIDKIKQSKGKPAMDVSFAVGGHSMGGMPTKQKLHVLSMAVHTFDMMESVLVRVNELADQQQKTGKQE